MIPACMMVTIVTHTGLRACRNRFYYEGSPYPTTTAHGTVVANGFHGTFAPLMAALMADTASVHSVEVSVQNGSGEVMWSLSNATPVEGVIPTDPDGDESVPDQLPDEVSVILRLKTGQPGRQNRGRRFITGLAEQINMQGVIVPTFNTPAKNLAAKCADDVVIGASGGYAGGTFHARHWNRKDNTLVPISLALAIRTLGSRIDRRRPLRLDNPILL